MTDHLLEQKSSQKSQQQNESISLTCDAVEATRKLKQDSAHEKFDVLRVYLSGKGCDGFTYGVQFDDRRDGDMSFPQSGDNFSIDLVCDSKSYMFLKGSSIDYVDDERGKGYLVENPSHRRYRGKFYKKKVWQQRLQDSRTESSSIDDIESE